MKKLLLGLSFALWGLGMPTAEAEVQIMDSAKNFTEDSTETQSYYLLEHRVQPCEVWITNGRGDFVCAHMPRRRYVADSRTFADAVVDLDRRVRELEERVRELEEAASE